MNVLVWMDILKLENLSAKNQSYNVTIVVKHALTIFNAEVVHS
jgi:hypothetical protein